MIRHDKGRASLDSQIPFQLTELFSAQMPVRVAPEGTTPEFGEGYLLAVAAGGEISLHIVLALTESRQNLFYVFDTNPVPKGSYGRYQKEGLTFLESIGFAMEQVPPQEMETVVNRLSSLGVVKSENVTLIPQAKPAVTAAAFKPGDTIILEIKDPTNNFVPEQGLSAIEYTQESEVLDVLRSASPVAIPVSGFSPQLTEAYLCSLCFEGEYVFHIAFRLLESKLIVFYTPKSPVADERALERMRGQAAIFLTSIGFRINQLSLVGSSALREVVIRNIPILKMVAERKRSNIQVSKGPEPRTVSAPTREASPIEESMFEFTAAPAYKPQPPIQPGPASASFQPKEIAEPSVDDWLERDSTPMAAGRETRYSVPASEPSISVPVSRFEGSSERFPFDTRAEPLPEPGADSLNQQVSNASSFESRGERFQSPSLPEEKAAVRTQAPEMAISSGIGGDPFYSDSKGDASNASTKASDPFYQEQSAADPFAELKPNQQPLGGPQVSSPLEAPSKVAGVGLSTPQFSVDTTSSKGDDFFFSGFGPADGTFSFAGNSAGADVNFTVDSAQNHVNAIPTEVRDLYRSIGAARVAPPGYSTQLCDAYIVALRRGTGNEVYIALYLTENEKILVYTPDRQPQREDGYMPTIQCAIHFLESIGFMMDHLDLSGGPARVAQSMAALPIFSPQTLSSEKKASAEPLQQRMAVPAATEKTTGMNSSVAWDSVLMNEPMPTSATALPSPGVFQVDSKSSSIVVVAPTSVLEVFRSLSSAFVAPQGMPSQQCDGYLCLLRVGESLQVVLALFLQQMGKSVIYRPTIPVKPENLRSVVQEGVNFLESIGFIMDRVTLPTDGALKAKLFNELPVFAVSQVAPAEASVSAKVASTHTSLGSPQQKKPPVSSAPPVAKVTGAAFASKTKAEAEKRSVSEQLARILGSF